MIEINTCRYCGNNKPIMTDKSFIDATTAEVKHKIKISCRKCYQEFETETNNPDYAIAAWNWANRQ